MNAVMTEPQTERTTLYYREGSSDKVYQVSLEPKGELFIVHFAYGRRGATLNTGTKTSSPVDYTTAKNTFDKLVREKTAKGYTPGEDGTPYRHIDKENQATEILPQLLNPVEEYRVATLVRDREHCAQEKFDGRRLLVRKHEAEIHGINRKGLLIGLPEPVFQAVHALPGDFVIDGECVGDVLYAFDLLETSEGDQRKRGYQTRYLRLMNVLGASNHRSLVLAETAFTPKQKGQLLENLRKQNKEGIVFKRLDAPYTQGRPNSGGSQLKHKFYATLSAVVSKVNPQRSVEVRLLNCKGWVPVGNVTIPPNQSVPAVGQIVELRYLYAFRESNCLYQPTYLGLRQDVERHECVLSQLKYKSSNEEEG
jgi:bifunctional non-homologous end joining protein LigD